MKIALVHDELVRRGGAEVVFEELIRLFPQADVYSLYAGRPIIEVDSVLYNVGTSFLQQLPVWFRRHPKRLLPLLPYAAEQLDFSDYQIVISSASGFVKAIVTRANIPHLCYCHTPTRYLWDNAQQVLVQQSPWWRWPAQLWLHYLRLADFTAAQRVDRFLANSAYTQARIQTYYRRTSRVVYPPIETDFYTPNHSLSIRSWRDRDYFLCVGRLTPSKYFDQAIRVCEKLGFNLVVVGKGSEQKRLASLAGRHTHFVDSISPTQLRDYYRHALALIQPGIEDFGMASVEAIACGTPVIALGIGGAREIITHRAEGYLYREQREEALAEAIRSFLADRILFDPQVLHTSAQRFSKDTFASAIYSQVEAALSSKK